MKYSEPFCETLSVRIEETLLSGSYTGDEGTPGTIIEGGEDYTL